MGFLSSTFLFNKISISDVLRPPSRQEVKIKKDRRLNALDKSPNASLTITMRPKKMLDIPLDELLTRESKLKLKKTVLVEKINRNNALQLEKQKDVFMLNLLEHQLRDINYLKHKHEFSHTKKL